MYKINFISSNNIRTVKLKASSKREALARLDHIFPFPPSIIGVYKLNEVGAIIG